MQPTFGSDVYHLLFEPIDDQMLAQATRKTIGQAIDEWMPYVQIVNVKTTSRKEEHIVLIEVEYTVDGWPVENTLNMGVRI